MNFKKLFRPAGLFALLTLSLSMLACLPNAVHATGDTISNVVLTQTLSGVQWTDAISFDFTFASTQYFQPLNIVVTQQFETCDLLNGAQNVTIAGSKTLYAWTHTDSWTANEVRSYNTSQTDPDQPPQSAAQTQNPGYFVQRDSYHYLIRVYINYVLVDSAITATKAFYW